MTADDVHAQLERALGHAKRLVDEPAKDSKDAAHQVLDELVQPLALASIAMELRALRLAISPRPFPPIPEDAGNWDFDTPDKPARPSPWAGLETHGKGGPIGG